MLLQDTIVAVSSATGPAPRMIVRISGPAALQIAKSITRVETPIANSAHRVKLNFANLSLPAWLYTFPKPRSFTGEDLLEFHIPGNPILARLILDQLTAAGARLAEPGEFTARAFFSGKLDLAQAEGVAAAIGAQTGEQLSAARQLMAGELSRRLQPIMESIAKTLAILEASIDFSEEEIDSVNARQIGETALALLRSLGDLVDHSTVFESIPREPTIVLVGRPNAGKSTLINALAGQARSVVSDLAGTTRDVLSAEVALERGMVRLHDVAGLEDGLGENLSKGEIGRIEGQMRERALRAVEEASAVVLVVDSTDARPVLDLPRRPDLIVASKADLPAIVCPVDDRIAISAVTGQNLPTLRAKLDSLAFGPDSAGFILSLTARHRQCIKEASVSIARVINSQAFAPELAAADLRSTLDSLGQVLGEVTPDDILAKIFASFCIGK